MDKKDFAIAAVMVLFIGFILYGLLQLDPKDRDDVIDMMQTMDMGD